MEMCSDGHNEICYERQYDKTGRKWSDCPLCEMLEEKQDEIDNLNEKIIELEEEKINQADKDI